MKVIITIEYDFEEILSDEEAAEKGFECLSNDIFLANMPINNDCFSVKIER